MGPNTYEKLRHPKVPGPGGNVLLAIPGGFDLRPTSRYRPPAGRGQKPRPPLPPPHFAAPPLPNRLFRSRLAGSFTTCTTSPLCLEQRHEATRTESRCPTLSDTSLVVLTFRAPPALDGLWGRRVGFRNLRCLLGRGQERGELPVIQWFNKDLPDRRCACLEGGVGVARKSCGEGRRLLLGLPPPMYILAG